MPYAEQTSVPVEKTRAELEALINKHRADAFGYMTEPGRALIQFRSRSKTIRFVLPLPDLQEKRFWKTPAKGLPRSQAEAFKAWEQDCRSAWRALYLAVKAKLEAVERGITTFEQEFMAHIVLPTGRTAAEELLPLIEEATQTGKMPQFTLALPASGGKE